jgi:hypothetical protein
VVVIGQADDPHVAAVLDASGSTDDALVVDAQSLPSMNWSVGPGAIRLDDRVVLEGTKGWVRRVAPAGHQEGLVLGSVDAAEHSAWLGLMTSLMRLDGIDWLSTFDAVMRAEDKLVQYAACARLSILCPDTVVASCPEGLRERFGDEVVVKPLGPGHFSDTESGFKIVPAQTLTTQDERLAKLAGAPFIVQQRIDAHAHLRVVTVLDDVFAARLDATDLPLDWRTDVAAHHNFAAASLPAEVRHDARRLARELGVRYSSQDWVVAPDGIYFLDLNPVGQWLFLPEEIAGRVTSALAAWISGVER